MSLLNVPSELILPPYCNYALQLNGVSLVDSCFYNERTVGKMYLEDHVIIYVLKGRLTLISSQHTWTVLQGQYILLQRAQCYEFVKEGIASTYDSAFHGFLFCLKDEFVISVAQSLDILQKNRGIFTPLIRNGDDVMKQFIQSVNSLFHDQSKVSQGLLKLKIKELLYYIVSGDTEMESHILSLGCPPRIRLEEIMDRYFLERISIPDIAFLSGRSLSNFKREFSDLFGISPALYIRKRRLAYGYSLLKKSDMSVAEVANRSGFDNYSHYSRLMKKYYGKTPKQIRLS